MLHCCTSDLKRRLFKLHRHPLEVVIGRIIGIGRSHRHSGSGERPFVRYPLYPAGAGGLWITTLERHAAKLCYFCTFCHREAVELAAVESHVDLLGDCQSVVDLDAEVPRGTFDLGMAQ
jgi:hypothetical protein